jgi:hypothetical protein
MSASRTPQEPRPERNNGVFSIRALAAINGNEEAS